MNSIPVIYIVTAFDFPYSSFTEREKIFFDLIKPHIDYLLNNKICFTFYLSSSLILHLEEFHPDALDILKEQIALKKAEILTGSFYEIELKYSKAEIFQASIKRTTDLIQNRLNYKPALFLPPNLNFQKEYIPILKQLDISGAIYLIEDNDKNSDLINPAIYDGEEIFVFKAFRFHENIFAESGNFKLYRKTFPFIIINTDTLKPDFLEGLTYYLPSEVLSNYFLRPGLNFFESNQPQPCIKSELIKYGLLKISKLSNRAVKNGCLLPESLFRASTSGIYHKEIETEGIIGRWFSDILKAEKQIFHNAFDTDMFNFPYIKLANKNIQLVIERSSGALIEFSDLIRCIALCLPEPEMRYWYSKYSLTEHFIHKNTYINEFFQGVYGEQSNIHSLSYQLDEFTDTDCSLSMDVSLVHNKSIKKVYLEKKIQLNLDSFSVRYSIKGLPYPSEVYFGTEFLFAPGCFAPDKYIVLDDGVNISMEEISVSHGINEFYFIDEEMNLKLKFSFNSEIELWKYVHKSIYKFPGLLFLCQDLEKDMQFEIVIKLESL